MFKISTVSRIILLVGALTLLVMLKVPIWYIYLTAPQYPEGLEMKIWHNTITGDVQVISALNHYIGMRPISVEMFPEFTYLGKVIMAVCGICLVLGAIGKWWSSVTYFLLLAIADSLALYDFWRWGYDYGHNLNPEAPIIIPGMAYQPPVIGYKKLLNFEAWSLPDIGGWILMALSTVAFGIVVLEWWKQYRKGKGKVPTGASMAKPNAAALALLLLPLGFWQCSTGPQPIAYGQDGCSFCKMTILDRHFGAEVVTTKGKVFKFDDINCFVHFLAKNEVAAGDIAGRYVTDYAHGGVWLEAPKAAFLKSETIKTPMASGVAAFANLTDLDAVKTQSGGEALNWEQVEKGF